MSDVLTRRLSALQAALSEARLRALAVVAGPNLYYLSGLSFHLSERPTVGFFPAEGNPVFVVPSLEETKLVGGGLPYEFTYATYTDSDGQPRRSSAPVSCSSRVASARARGSASKPGACASWSYA